MKAPQSRTTQRIDPLDGLAACCVSLVEDAVAKRSLTDAAGTAPGRLCATVARERLSREMKQLPAFKAGALGLERAVVMEAVIGAMAQVLDAISAGRIDAGQGRAALKPILRIAGANPAHVRMASQASAATRAGSAA